MDGLGSPSPSQIEIDAIMKKSQMNIRIGIDMDKSK